MKIKASVEQNNLLLFLSYIFEESIWNQDDFLDLKVSNFDLDYYVNEGTPIVDQEYYDIELICTEKGLKTIDKYFKSYFVDNKYLIEAILI